MIVYSDHIFTVNVAVRIHPKDFTATIIEYDNGYYKHFKFKECPNFLEVRRRMFEELLHKEYKIPIFRFIYPGLSDMFVTENNFYFRTYKNMGSNVKEDIEIFPRGKEIFTETDAQFILSEFIATGTIKYTPKTSIKNVLKKCGKLDWYKLKRNQAENFLVKNNLVSSALITRCSDTIPFKYIEEYIDLIEPWPLVRRNDLTEKYIRKYYEKHPNLFDGYLWELCTKKNLYRFNLEHFDEFTDENYRKEIIKLSLENKKIDK